jgi:hypothetical protein
MLRLSKLPPKLAAFIAKLILTGVKALSYFAQHEFNLLQTKLEKIKSSLHFFHKVKPNFLIEVVALCVLDKI